MSLSRALMVPDTKQRSDLPSAASAPAGGCQGSICQRQERDPKCGLPGCHRALSCGCLDAIPKSRQHPPAARAQARSPALHQPLQGPPRPEDPSPGQATAWGGTAHGCHRQRTWRGREGQLGAGPAVAHQPWAVSSAWPVRDWDKQWCPRPGPSPSLTRSVRVRARQRLGVAGAGPPGVAAGEKPPIKAELRGS